MPGKKFDQYTGIAVIRQSRLAHPARDLAIIVNFAIEREDDVAVPRRHGLVGGFLGAEDRKAVMPEIKGASGIFVAGIGPPMRETRHCL